MSLAAIATSKTVLDTILDSLVPLILPSAVDRDAASQAALDLLSDHHPATREELRLAAEVIGFSLQSLAALRDAAQPGIPISRAMRLRASACTLRRAEQAAQRKLDALQRVLRPAEPIQERAIAVAMKNAEPYFAGAYAKAREMGDALVAAASAAAPSTPSAVPLAVASEPAPPATPSHGPAPAGPTTGGSAAHAAATPEPAAAEFAVVATSLTNVAGLPMHPVATEAPTASGPGPTPSAPGTPMQIAATLTAPSPAPAPAAPAQIAPAPTQTASTLTAPSLAPAPAAPSLTPLTTNSLETGSNPQTPHRSAASHPPTRPHDTVGAPPFPPGRIGATLRYMKETLSRMDPNTSETGDFSTDFLIAIERGLPTSNAQGPVPPAA